MQDIGINTTQSYRKSIQKTFLTSFPVFCWIEPRTRGKNCAKIFRRERDEKKWSQNREATSLLLILKHCAKKLSCHPLDPFEESERGLEKGYKKIWNFCLQFHSILKMISFGFLSFATTTTMRICSIAIQLKKEQTKGPLKSSL